MAVIIALVAGLPLYLRSPLWCDITLYDLAARNLLQGGTHYRDLFDTNLPGFVWLLTGLRWLFGNDAIVVRIADLVVITGIVALIDRLAKWGGATPASRWWAIAGAAFLYPFAAEAIHAQRDIWMALPALAAVALRFRHIGREGTNGTILAPTSTVGTRFRESALEGLIWGMAVWLKPHVALMAAGVWLLSCFRLTSTQPRPWKYLLADLFGNLAGGLLVGLCGVAWLVASGTWDYFWQTLIEWNPKYMLLLKAELKEEWEYPLFTYKGSLEFSWFPPWSFWLILTLPLALLSIVDAEPLRRTRPSDPVRPGPMGRLLPSWLWDRQAGWNARFVRGMLAVLYLVWLAQAYFLQRRFHYAHVPETLLMFGLWAAHRWAMPLIPLLWLTITSCLWLYADADPAFKARLITTIANDKVAAANSQFERFFIRHPLADKERMKCWPECWRFDLSRREEYALRDRLRQIRDFEASICWEEIDDVAEFLKGKGVKDGQVIAWHDSPHAVYLMLGIKPGIRFMHLSTAQFIDCKEVEKELVATSTQDTAIYVIGDLEMLAADQRPEEQRKILGPPQPGSNDLLPAELPPGFRSFFPYDQPVEFRSRGGNGRYTVHKLRVPYGKGICQP